MTHSHSEADRAPCRRSLRDGFISPREAVVALLAAHLTMAAALLIAASGTPLLAAMLTAANAFPGAFRLADRVITRT